MSPDKTAMSSMKSAMSSLPLNGLPVHNYEEYSRAKESLPSGTDYQVIVSGKKSGGWKQSTETELSIPWDGAQSPNPGNDGEDILRKNQEWGER